MSRARIASRQSAVAAGPRTCSRAERNRTLLPLAGVITASVILAGCGGSSPTSPSMPSGSSGSSSPSSGSGSSSGSAQKFQYETVSDPAGQYEMTLFGINNAGQSVGYYSTQNGSSVGQGYLYSGGTYTPIDAPNAFATWAWGINNQGTIVGQYQDQSLLTHGFVLSSSGVYSTIDDSYDDVIGGSNGTSVYGVNDSGDLAGVHTVNGFEYGFLYISGKFTTISNGQSTSVGGINNQDQIAGSYYDATSGTYHGFIWTSGTFVYLDAPGAGSGSGEGTLLWGVNDLGNAVGFYRDAQNNPVSFYYISQTGTYETVAVPGAQYTYAYGLNNVGQLSGQYVTSNGATYGFIASPVP